MTRRERKIEEIKRQIASLQAKLKDLEALSGIDEEEKLYDFPDFPRTSVIRNAIINNRKDERDRRHYYLDTSPTVGDLIWSTPESLLQYPKMGEKRLKKITDWMEKHQIRFID